MTVAYQVLLISQSDDKNRWIFSHVCKRARVSDFKVNMQICQVHWKIARYLTTMKKKQDNIDKKGFRDKNFIQRNAKFDVRSKKRTNFLRVRNPHNTAVVYFISRPEKICAALRLKFWKLFQSTENLLLNNTLKTYQQLKTVFTGPWNCPNVAKRKSASSVFNF